MKLGRVGLIVRVTEVVEGRRTPTGAGVARVEKTLGAALAALLFGVPLGAQGTVPSTVTLDQAIQRSEAVQPSVISAAGQQESARFRVKTARAAYLPNLSFSSSGNQSYSTGPSRVDNSTGQVISGTTSSRSVSMSFSSGVELFDGFRRSNELRSARANEDQIDASFVDARYQNLLTTTTAFFDALIAGQVLKVREASVKRAEEQLNFSITRLRNASATRSDSLRSVVALGNANLSLLQARNTLANAEANLGRLVGSLDRVAAVDDSAYYQVAGPIDTTAIRAEALQSSPRVQISTAQVDAAEAAFAGSKSSIYPSLNLSLGQSWSGSQSSNYTLRQNRSLGLSLSWQLFNRFSREQTIDQARIALTNANANRDDAIRQLSASITQRLAELTTAREQVEIANVSVIAAEEDLRVVQERYRASLATIVDVLTSQEALTQAQVDVVSARYGWLQAKAQLEALIGRRL